MEGGSLETSEFEHLSAEVGVSTLLALALFVAPKLSVDAVRRGRTKVSLLLVGAGPVGLKAALVAVRSGKVLKLTLLDARPRAALCQPRQIALDPRFVLGLGNLEGCWNKGHFFIKVMKSIFQQSFNVYKTDIEPWIGEAMLHCIRSSHRLFKIMLSHRGVATAFLAEDNIVVAVEGEGARMLNFDTGWGINLGLKGLESTEELIYKVATAVYQQDIFEALATKIQHSKQVVEDFKQDGLSATMFE